MTCFPYFFPTRSLPAPYFLPTFSLLRVSTKGNFSKLKKHIFDTPFSTADGAYLTDFA